MKKWLYVDFVVCKICNAAHVGQFGVMKYFIVYIHFNFQKIIWKSNYLFKISNISFAY